MVITVFSDFLLKTLSLSLSQLKNQFQNNWHTLQVCHKLGLTTGTLLPVVSREEKLIAGRC